MTRAIEKSKPTAARDFSDEQIQKRIDAASQPGFGLDKATKAQIRMVQLLAQHYDVDPAVDITLFRGQPWFTIDGRIRMMKRHPQYAGYKTRPLGQTEKEAWGYKPDDLVIECTIRTKDWGEITARGKVSASEQRSNTPTGSHPSEMAEKRSIARCSRMAFGQDVPDEDETGYLVEERDDPERVQRNSDRYVEIFGDDDEQHHRVDRETGEVLGPEREVVDRAHAAAAERDRNVDEIEAERQRKQEGLL